PGADGPGTGACQLEKGRGPETLRVRDVDTVLRRQIVIEANPWGEPAERASPRSPTTFLCQRTLVQDLVAQPVPAAGDREHEAVGLKEDALSQIEGVLHIETHTILFVGNPGAECLQRACRSRVSPSRESSLETCCECAVVFLLEHL